MVPLAIIRPNARQPRQRFDEQNLVALADSIRAAGVMQPIIVRPLHNDQHELIAGERRWRAAQLVGLAHVPAIIRDVDDRTAAEWALVENLQREDLNTIDRAEAFRRLVDEFGLTHQELADRVGLNRVSITNHLRLLELDGDTLDAVRHDLLTMGHARALLGIANNERRAHLARRAIKAQWSVRELERHAQATLPQNQRTSGRAPGRSTSSASGRTPAQSNIADLEKRLGEHLGTRVSVQIGRKKGSGKLIIDFYSFEQFEGLLDQLGFDQNASP